MSVRENIASNIKTVVDAISSPDVKLCTRQPFELEELSQAQYPAVIVQTSEENREKSKEGDFVLLGFVKGANTNIDTLRNELITAIETALESDITRSGNALDTEVVQVETDEGTLFPVGGIRMVVRCMYQYQSGTP
jgi:hypothetical protein